MLSSEEAESCLSQLLGCFSQSVLYLQNEKGQIYHISYGAPPILLVLLYNNPKVLPNTNVDKWQPRNKMNQIEQFWTSTWRYWTITPSWRSCTESWFRNKCYDTYVIKMQRDSFIGCKMVTCVLVNNIPCAGWLQSKNLYLTLSIRCEI